MIPETIKEAFVRTRDKGDNVAIKLETPDVVYSTNEIVDLMTLLTSKSNDKPGLYLIRPDRISEYSWQKMEWEPPSEIPINQSIDVLEKSRNGFAIFIFWDLALRLDDREGHPTVRGFIPNLFLSPKTTKKLIICLEPIGTVYPDLINPYLLNYTEPYPSKKEFIPAVVRELKGEGLDQNIKDEHIEQVSEALLGLSFTSAINTLRQNVERTKDFNEIVNCLNREKEDILSRTLGMSILKPVADDIPFGMEFLMKDLEIKKSSICKPGQNREKGWFLIGTPGSGKSLLAKYLGKILGYPAISFNISEVMSSFVGQTEKNMHNMTKVLEAFAPCILYIDEFEKALSFGGEQDGGTMMRAIGILLTFLNDTNAPIFLLASANNLDPQHGLALTRRGRFSQIYWVGEPSREARLKICEAAFKREKFDVPDTLLNDIAAETMYFSGADLAWLCREAVIQANYNSIKSPTGEFRKIISDLIEENRPRVHTMKENYNPLRKWAKAYCRPAGLPPED